MKRKYFQPYGIDEEYEYRTYRHVGVDYDDMKNACLGWRFKLKWFLRKKRNPIQTKYAVCNTYSEWENHVKGIIRYDIINGYDLVHWLYKKRNGETQHWEILKLVLIPIYIAYLTTSNFFNEMLKEYGTTGSMASFILFAVIIILVSYKVLFEAQEKVNFYNDLIKIVEKELIDK